MCTRKKEVRKYTNGREVNKCNKIYYTKLHSVSAPYISMYLHKIIFKFCVSKATVDSACSEVRQSRGVKHVCTCACACALLM